jgi:hypothetical protein
MGPPDRRRPSVRGPDVHSVGGGLESDVRACRPPCCRRIQAGVTNPDSQAARKSSAGLQLNRSARRRQCRRNELSHRLSCPVATSFDDRLRCFHPWLVKTIKRSRRQVAVELRPAGRHPGLEPVEDTKRLCRDELMARLSDLGRAMIDGEPVTTVGKFSALGDTGGSSPGA